MAIPEGRRRFHRRHELRGTIERHRALGVSTDYLLGRVELPGMAEAGDPLYRDVGKLTGHDREIAKDFLKMLAAKNQAKAKE